MNSDAKIISTNDGSDSVFLPNLNETYHSIHGALQESEHVYIKSGLDYYLEKYPDTTEINVLEVGMGTGLNVILTVLWAIDNNVKINFTTLEPFPLPKEIMSAFSIGKLKETPQAEELFSKIHSSEWNTTIELDKYFSLFKIKDTLEDANLLESKFNIVYYDAFAPNKQENIWNSGNLSKVFTVLDMGGVLTTYCAKGQVRRDFQNVGFEVQRIEGPPGKREMLRCLKQ